jgi:hypothetical protein
MEVPCSGQSDFGFLTTPLDFLVKERMRVLEKSRVVGMSFEYNGFTVGERVRLTVEFPPSGGNGLRHTVSHFTGKVTMPDKGDYAGTIRMTTGNVHFPERIVPVDKITNRGKVRKRVKLIDKTWEVTSKSRPGKFHTVTKSGRIWSCTCEAWQYRGYCQHVKKKQIGG